MFDTLKRLILPDTSLHCPRCDKSLEGHDEAGCARRMSRRFFFQVAAGAAVVVAAAPLIDTEPLSMSLDDFSAQFIAPAMEAVARSVDRFLTPQMISNEMITVLHNNVAAAKLINRRYEAEFASGMKIGDTIQFRKPARYLSA